MVTIDNLFDKMKNDDLKQFNIIVKTDVQGTAEAFKSSLEKLSNEEVLVKVLHSSAGAVTESDVELAKAANAIIIAFNVRPVGATKQLAEKEGVEIKQYSIIYQALEDVQNAMKGMLAPVYQEITIGNAEVRQVFKVSNVGTIAGCYVTDGKVARNAGVRVIREGVVIHEGKLVSLKRFKDDAKEVSAGFECGVQIENFNDIILGDTIEAYIKQEVQR
jgi:translation initiation factor IF-2